MSKKRKKHKPNSRLRLFNYRKIKNIYIRYILISLEFILRALIILFKNIFKTLRNTISLSQTLFSKNKQKNDDDCIDIENYKEKKVFSPRCAVITALIIIIVTIFVYRENSFFYIYPLITVVLPFTLLSEGINYDFHNKYKDLPLYEKILFCNLILFMIIYIVAQKKDFYINFYLISVFVIPLIVCNLDTRK